MKELLALSYDISSARMCRDSHMKVVSKADANLAPSLASET